MRGTSGNVQDLLEGNRLVHGQEVDAYGDTVYQGIQKRTNAKPGETCHVALRSGKRKTLNKIDQLDQLTNKIEKVKASVRTKVEHSFRVIKCQFVDFKTRYRGLKKNTAQLVTLLALSNLWMVQATLQGAQA